MGLGLAVVKRLCQRMGGDVIVDSELGKGSCFMCSLPVGQPDAIAPKATYKTLTELRALVIEDNATQRAALVRHLEQFGLHCAETDSVNAAISNYLKRTQHDASLAFNIVYLNIELVVDDLSVLASMIYEKTQLAGVKLILTGTQNAFKKTDVIAEKKGMRFLSKPFTKKSILATLNVTDNKPLGNTSNADNTYSDNKHSDNKHSDKNVSDLSHLQSEPNERPSIFNSARILLVEDNEVNQEVASYILEDENFQFDIASNGLEALEALAKPCDSSPNNKSYALVLMDCQMPKMDGYETTRNIRKGSVGEHIKNIPIIAMTANTLHGDEQKCRDAGMDDYLAKPIDADTVISKIYYWLEKSNHIKNAAGN